MKISISAAKFAAAFVGALVLWISAPASAPLRGVPLRAGQTHVQRSSAELAGELGDRDPLRRQRAAEELARLSAAEQRKILEGYRAQEKDARVKLAMDWALYRVGKSEALFPLVSALGSKKHAEQSVAYLKMMETPEPLYVFLGRTNGNTQIRLLEVLAAVGNEGTLEKIEPFVASLDPGIADAAKFAQREIRIRIEEAPVVESKRPRRTGDDPTDPLR